MTAQDLPAFVAYLADIGFLDKEQAEGILQLPTFEVRELRQRSHYGPDTMLFRMEVEQNPQTGALTAAGYQATLLQLSFAHGTYEGINTRQLERELVKYNWDAAGREHYDNSDVSETFSQLVALSQSTDPSARLVSGMLMLRHWSNTELEPFTAGLVDRSQYERRTFFPLEDPMQDVTVDEAHSLLSGRAVLRTVYDQAGSQHKMQWHTLEGDTLKAWPMFDIAGILRNLPFARPLDDNTGPEMIVHLAKGERVPVEVFVKDVRTPAELEVDAAGGTLAVYRQDGVRLDTAELLAQGPRQEQPAKKNRQGLSR